MTKGGSAAICPKNTYSPINNSPNFCFGVNIWGIFFNGLFTNGFSLRKTAAKRKMPTIIGVA
jgi:hypothetical protein